MMQLHLTKEGYGLTQEFGFEPRMQSSHRADIDLSQTPWVWHGRHRQIFGRDIWLFFEADSQFCLCFFDIQPRAIKQLDLTLWQRFVSEYTFMSTKHDQHSPISISDEFLSVVRSWMAPLEVFEMDSQAIDARADYVFNQILTYLKRPHPIHMPTRDEMEFSWRINTDLRPETQQSNKSDTNASYELDRSIDAKDMILRALTPHSDVVDLSQRGQNFSNSDEDEIAIMESIHQQLKTNVLSYISPATLFTNRVSHMLNAGRIKLGELLNFTPRR